MRYPTHIYAKALAEVIETSKPKDTDKIVKNFMKSDPKERRRGPYGEDPRRNDKVHSQKQRHPQDSRGIR